MRVLVETNIVLDALLELYGNVSLSPISHKGLH
jgi:hypothetical protein